MKRFISVIISLVAVIGLLSGCDKKQSASAPTPAKVEVKTDTDMFTDRDSRDSYDGGIEIKLSGDSASATSDSVKISGGTVTITEDATYIISGSLNNGAIVVDAPDTAKMQLVLDGASITSKDSAALNIVEADKVFITLASGSENSLSNGGVFENDGDTNIDAALFSKQDITLNGSGALTVTSPAGHGIVSKDDLVITGGSYTVNAASHGFDANDSIRITGNTDIKVDAGKDGIHAENNDDATLGFVYISGGRTDIEAEGDGISAGAYMQIEDGTVSITAGGGSENGTKASSDGYGGFMGGGMHQRPHGMGPRQTVQDTADTDSASTSMKGLKAVGELLISGGEFKIDSADDGIHSDDCVTINGGEFEIASGDDAMHAEKTLTVSDGKVNITESYEGLEALDIAVSGGDIKMVATDDGLNAAGGTDNSGITGGRDGMFGGPGGRPGGGMGGASNGSIAVSGGTLYINSSGDGLDANGTLTISGGHTTVVGPTQGDTATLDYDISATITGGTFIGTGASNMAQTFSECKQGVIALSVGSMSAGTEIVITDADGKMLLSYTPELPYQVVIISTPELTSGKTYTVTVGTESGEFEAM